MLKLFVYRLLEYTGIRDLLAAVALFFGWLDDINDTE